MGQWVCELLRNKQRMDLGSLFGKQMLILCLIHLTFELEKAKLRRHRDQNVYFDVC